MDLFVSRAFFNDLSFEIPELRQIDFSGKIFTIENELTRYRYDVLLQVDKASPPRKAITSRLKYQDYGGVLEKLPVGNPGIDISPYQLAYILYTSGTTGVPKGVMLEHRGVVNLAHWFGRTYGLQAGVKLLQLTGYSFDPSVEDIFSTLLHGASLYVADQALLSDMEKLREFICSHQIHIIDFIPALLKELLCSVEKLASLRVVISGGEKLEDELKDRLLALGYHLYNHYGPTEITVDALTSECSHDKVSLGTAIANTRCFILDRDNNLAAPGVPGELCIAGVGLARGYLNCPELTAEKFDQDLWDEKDDQDKKNKSFFRGLRGAVFSKKAPLIYKTGDLARWLPEGKIEFLGRIDQQVKIRGFRIETGEIENRLSKHADIKEVVVLVQEEESGDKYLCAYVVSDGENVIAELREYLSKELPDYMIPAYFVQLEKIPLTPNGKIDRRALSKPELKIGENYTPPRNEMEKKLVEIWESVLGVHNIGINDNFFAVGGDSIKTIQIVSRLNTAGYKLFVKDIFNNPTISGLSPVVKLQQHITVQLKVTGHIPLTPIQRCFFEESLSSPHHYNHSVMFYTSDECDKTIL
jgi:amino acid adenylation domain-containing protein